MPSYVFIARASVYNLYASTCLGGWENTHLAAGAPEAPESGGALVFAEGNSARLNGNVHAQIYCGGFSGDILENTVPKKILVKFSWAVEYPRLDSEPSQTTEESATTTDAIGEKNVEAANIEDTVDSESVPSSQESIAEPEIMQPQELPSSAEGTEIIEPEQNSQDTPPPEESTASIFDFFTTIAYAQEIQTEESTTTATTDVPTETVASTTLDVSAETVASTTLDTAMTTEETSHGLVEVLYTLDGVAWKSLGFVKKDEFSSKHFEIPIEEASEWEDISKIQIGVQSVPVLDGVAPTIYLDAVWLEVEYQAPWDDPFISPGKKEGDSIISEVSFEHMTAVLVSRKEPMLIGAPYLELWLATTPITEPTSSPSGIHDESGGVGTLPLAVENSVGALDIHTASGTPVDISSASSFPDAISSTATPVILPKPIAKEWRFIAGGELLSRDPRIAFIDGNVFWFGVGDASVWRFNPATGAFDSVSLNLGDAPEFLYENQSGEKRILRETFGGVFASEPVAEPE